MRSKLIVGAACAAVAFAVGQATSSAETPVPPPTGAIVAGVSGTYCPSPSYSTIQSAIDAAGAGSTIYVCAGTYNENLTIDKPLTLDGAQYDVDALGRDGSAETVVNGTGGVTYTAGATSGTINGFTLTGYTGATAEIDASGVGSGWRFIDNIIDASDGGLYMNTDALTNPAPTSVKANVFVQSTPSAATSGDEGQAVLIAGGTANNVTVGGNSFENLSGPGAAITTPGTAACGSTLDTTNFSEHLVISNNTMSEDGGSFTDPLNGPGFVDEPFLDLQCTNEAHVRDNSVAVTDAGDAHAKTAVDLSGGDWSTEADSNTLSGDGATAATGIDLNDTSYPAGTEVALSGNTISGYNNGIQVNGATEFSISRNNVTSSGRDGIAVEGGTLGTLTENAATGSGTEDCLDTTHGSGTASTADTWTGNGGATSSPAGLCGAFVHPIFTSSTHAMANTGSPFSFDVTTTGYPLPSLRMIHGLRGLGLADKGDGTATIAGTLAPGTAGVHVLKIEASNVFRATFNRAVQDLTLQVDRAPVITSPATKHIAPGVHFTFVVKTVGFPYPTLSETGALPSGVTFTNDGHGRATFAGTPTAPLSSVNWPITLTATSAAGTFDQSFALTSRQLPLAFTDPLTATAVIGQPFSHTISTSTAYGPPTLSETGALPAGIRFVDNHNGTATFSGTTTSDTQHSFRVVVRAATAAGSTSRPFSLLVDSKPVFTSPSSLTVHVGRRFSFSVRAPGFPHPVFSESGTLPPGVSFVGLADSARLSGRPTASGSSSLTFTATNSAGSTSQSFTLMVH